MKGMCNLDNTEKMRQTLDLARQAMEAGELPVAAIIFRGDERIAASHTSERADRRYLVHAELKVLLEADTKGFSFQDRRSMQLFVNLEPCLMCLGAAASFFIGEIHYALESPEDGAARVAQSWSPGGPGLQQYRFPALHGGLLRAESQDLFRQYAALSKPGAMRNFAEGLGRL